MKQRHRQCNFKHFINISLLQNDVQCCICRVTKTASSVTSDQELSEDDRTLDDAGSSRSIRELQNQRSFHSQRKDIRTKPVKAFPPPNNFQLQNKVLYGRKPRKLSYYIINVFYIKRINSITHINKTF